jgi:hypothetical protein
MFRISAEFNEQFELTASLERVRAFFSEPRNFVGLMPNLERITNEGISIRRWLISADVPVLGRMRESFAVRQVEDKEERIEWAPAVNEKHNLLRYAAAFEQRGANILIRIAQRVEIRRERARDLHSLAGWVGESLISAEMQKRVTEMMRTFLQNARAQLEGA